MQGAGGSQKHKVPQAVDPSHGALPLCGTQESPGASTGTGLIGSPTPGTVGREGTDGELCPLHTYKGYDQGTDGELRLTASRKARDPGWWPTHRVPWSSACPLWPLASLSQKQVTKNHSDVSQAAALVPTCLFGQLALFSLAEDNRPIPQMAPQAQRGTAQGQTVSQPEIWPRRELPSFQAGGGEGCACLWRQVVGVCLA